MTKDGPNDERPASEIILYQTEDGATRLSVRLEGETGWLPQAMMDELYQTTKQNISLHVRNISSEGELEEESVVKDSLTTAADGDLEAEATCKDYFQVRSEGSRQVVRSSFVPDGPARDDIGSSTQTGVLLRESA